MILLIHEHSIRSGKSYAIACTTGEINNIFQRINHFGHLKVKCICEMKLCIFFTWDFHMNICHECLSFSQSQRMQLHHIQFRCTERQNGRDFEFIELFFYRNTGYKPKIIEMINRIPDFFLYQMKMFTNKLIDTMKSIVIQNV